MEFVNEVIDRYRVICEGGSPEQSRRFTVIQKLYLQLPTLTIKRIATYLNVDEKTVRRDEHAAVNELSIMLFGIDGLNDLSK
nr:HTH domain-containing protein [Secundilactobacillus kimchicus]